MKELKKQILEDTEKEDEKNSTWFNFNISIKAHVNSDIKKLLYWMLYDKKYDTHASNRIYHLRSLKPDQVWDFKINQEKITIKLEDVTTYPHAYNDIPSVLLSINGREQDLQLDESIDIDIIDLINKEGYKNGKEKRIIT